MWAGLKHTVRTVPKSNGKIIETGIMNTLLFFLVWYWYFYMYDFVGVLQADTGVIRDGKQIFRLFCHESMRVFHDRLINNEDKNYFYHILADMANKHFGEVSKNYTYVALLLNMSPTASLQGHKGFIHVHSLHLLAQKPNLEKLSIYSNKFFHNFHLSESSFTCPGLLAIGVSVKTVICNYKIKC